MEANWPTCRNKLADLRKQVDRLAKTSWPTCGDKLTDLQRRVDRLVKTSWSTCKNKLVNLQKRNIESLNNVKFTHKDGYG